MIKVLLLVSDHASGSRTVLLKHSLPQQGSPARIIDPKYHIDEANPNVLRMFKGLQDLARILCCIFHDRECTYTPDSDEQIFADTDTNCADSVTCKQTYVPQHAITITMPWHFSCNLCQKSNINHRFNRHWNTVKKLSVSTEVATEEKPDLTNIHYLNIKNNFIVLVFFREKNTYISFLFERNR